LAFEGAFDPLFCPVVDETLDPWLESTLNPTPGSTFAPTPDWIVDEGEVIEMFVSK
jgi:hypothetical protein